MFLLSLYLLDSAYAGDHKGPPSRSSPHSPLRFCDIDSYAQVLQVLKEMRVAFADMLNAAERETATTTESADCQGHEQSMVVVTIDNHSAFAALVLTRHDNSA